MWEKITQFQIENVLQLLLLYFKGKIHILSDKVYKYYYHPKNGGLKYFSHFIKIMHLNIFFILKSRIKQKHLQIQYKGKH